MNVECPHCKASIAIPVANAGERANCPYCTGTFIIPSPSGGRLGEPVEAGTSRASSDRPYANQVPGGNSLPVPTDAHYQEFVKLKPIAGVLAFLFGAFGVHKFVLGLKGPGMTMLIVSLLGIFFGGCFVLPTIGLILMAITGAVEGFIYLTKPDYAFYQTYAIEKKGWF